MSHPRQLPDNCSAGLESHLYSCQLNANIYHSRWCPGRRGMYLLLGVTDVSSFVATAAVLEGIGVTATWCRPQHHL